MLEKLKLAVSSNEAFGGLLTDFKLHSYGLSLTRLFPMHPFSTPWKHQKTLQFSDVFMGYRKGASGANGLTLQRMLSDYLSNRKQRIKVENVFRKWENIKTGIPPGSILSPLLFYIFACDLLSFLDNT